MAMWNEEQLNAAIKAGATAVVTEHEANRAAGSDDPNKTTYTREEVDARIAEVKAEQEKLRVGMVPGSAEDTHRGEKFSMVKAYNSVAMRANGVTGWREHAPLEWEMHDASLKEYGSDSIVVRAQATSPDSLGGFVVPGEVRDEFFVEALRPKIILFDLGMSELTATSTPVDIPAEGTVPTVDAVSENQLNTAADVTFENLRAEPHTMQSFIKASNSFLAMGSKGEAYLRQIMARELAIQANAWGLTGTGANGQPLGVKNAGGVLTQAFTDSDATVGTVNANYQELLTMEEQVADADALDGALGFAMGNRALRALRTINSKNAAGDTESLNLDRNAVEAVTQGAFQAILGYPFRRSTALASGTAADDLLFGDWSRLLMVSWGSLVIEASRVANDALQRRQTHIVAYQDVDFVVTKPTAFCIATSWDLTNI